MGTSYSTIQVSDALECIGLLWRRNVNCAKVGVNRGQMLTPWDWFYCLLSEWLAIYFLKERVCRNVWRLNLRKTRNVWQKTLRCFIVPYSTWEKRKFKNDTVQCCDLWQLEWTNMKYIAFYPKYDTLLCFSYTSFLTILSYQKYHRILMNQINP